MCILKIVGQEAETGQSLVVFGNKPPTALLVSNHEVTTTLINEKYINI